MNAQETLVLDEIIRILSGKFHISEAMMTPENLDKPITGSHFRFSAVDLTFLFFELEKAFGISIDTEYLQNYGFSTINKMASAIAQCVGRQIIA